MIREDEIGGARSTYVEDRGAYRTLVGKPEGKAAWKNEKSMRSYY